MANINNYNKINRFWGSNSVSAARKIDKSTGKSQKDLTCERLNNLLTDHPETGVTVIKALVDFKKTRNDSWFSTEQAQADQSDKLTIIDNELSGLGNKYPTLKELEVLVKNSSYFVQRDIPTHFKNFLIGLADDVKRQITDSVNQKFLQDNGIIDKPNSNTKSTIQDGAERGGSLFIKCDISREGQVVEEKNTSLSSPSPTQLSNQFDNYRDGSEQNLPTQALNIKEPTNNYIQKTTITQVDEATKETANNQNPLLKQRTEISNLKLQKDNLEKQISEFKKGYAGILPQGKAVSTSSRKPNFRSLNKFVSKKNLESEIKDLQEELKKLKTTVIEKLNKNIDEGVPKIKELQKSALTNLKDPNKDLNERLIEVIQFLKAFFNIRQEANPKAQIKIYHKIDKDLFAKGTTIISELESSHPEQYKELCTVEVLKFAQENLPEKKLFDILYYDGGTDMKFVSYKDRTENDALDLTYYEPLINKFSDAWQETIVDRNLAEINKVNNFGEQGQDWEYPITQK